MSKTKITLDFETRSFVDLTKTTQARYAEDPSTEVLCLSLKVGGTPTWWWAPAWVSEAVRGNKSDPAFYGQEIDLTRLEEIVFAPSTENHAHNAGFERAIWREIMHKRFDLPDIPLEHWRCTAAKAAMHALPRSLDKAGAALSLPIKKDKVGHALMMKMCKPLPPSKKQYQELADNCFMPLSEIKAKHESKDMRARWYSAPDDSWLVRWHETPEALEALIRYCIQDSEAEHALDKRLVDLPDYEQELWFLDQRINDRGLPVDVEGCRAMVAFTVQEQEKNLEAFREATGGAVDSPKCYKAFAAWLGVKSVDKAAVEELLASEGLSDHVRRALEITQASNKSSVAKYDSLLLGLNADDRIRGCFLYHGAGTGRASGKLFQPQNLPRGTFTDVDLCYEIVSALEFKLAATLWGDPMHIASTCIRGAIKAPEGKELLAADYSAIEGRVIAWLAGEEDKLEAYRQGKDAYVLVASKAFDVPYDEIMSGIESGDAAMKELRQNGKTGDLACGFGGGQNAIYRFAPHMEKAERVEQRPLQAPSLAPVVVRQRKHDVAPTPRRNVLIQTAAPIVGPIVVEGEERPPSPKLLILRAGVEQVKQGGEALLLLVRRPPQQVVEHVPLEFSLSRTQKYTIFHCSLPQGLALVRLSARVCKCAKAVGIAFISLTLHLGYDHSKLLTGTMVCCSLIWQTL